MLKHYGSIYTSTILKVYFWLLPIVLDLYETRPEGVDESSLKIFAFGGSAVSEEQLRKNAKLFPKAMILYTYGQTEVALTFELSGQKEKAAGSLGQPIKGKTYRVNIAVQLS